MNADIGVLISEKQLNKALSGKYGFEFLPLYVEAGAAKNVTVIFFSDVQLISEDEVEGYYWNPHNNSFHKGIFSIPYVIHNRLRSKKQMNNVHEVIKEKSNVILYNSSNKFNKWKVHRHLKKHQSAHNYLPSTAKLTSVEQVVKWLNQYETIYLKPCSSSLGKGVIKLTKKEEEIECTTTVKNNFFQKTLPLNDLSFYIHHLITRHYIIQEGIPVITQFNSPIDFRVSVQKGEKGTWEITGIVGKIGKVNGHVSNLAMGGQAVNALTILLATFEETRSLSIYQDIKKASIEIAEAVENLSPYMADLGLDIAVTKIGEIRLIEVNGRDLRISFQKAKEYEMWKQTYYNPIYYGKFLLDAYLNE